MVFINFVKTLTPNSDYTDLKYSLIDYAFFFIPMDYHGDCALIIESRHKFFLFIIINEIIL